MDTMIKKACQNPTDEGLNECGLSVGSKCVADRSNTFIITPDFIRKLKIVGCKSYSKYMEWNDGNTDTVQGLPEHEMVEGRTSSGSGVTERSNREDNGTTPMRSLQESGADQRGYTDNFGSIEYDMTRKRLLCFVCSKPAVALGEDGIYLCDYCHERRKAGKPLSKMMDEAEAKNDKGTMS